MTDHHYALILAGGRGTRLFPTPHKPLLRLAGDESLFEQTVKRLDTIPPQHIWVVTDGELYPHLRALMPDLRFIREPSPRDTAPAVGLALLAIAEHDPQAVVAVLSSDHYIAAEGEATLRDALAKAYRQAERGCIALLSVPPTFPATGYGYIQHGSRCDEGVYQVRQFVEKPPQALAEQMIASGEWSWDAGMMVVRAQALLDEYARQQPAMLDCLRSAPERWHEITAISLDYAIIEHGLNRVVIPAAIEWSDVGSWDAIYQVLPKDDAENTLSPQTIAINTSGTLVRATKPTAVIGVQDLIIVDTPEALLVCARDQAQTVRQAAALIKSCRSTSG